ncbi:MAG TPA: hypothetical protein VFJ24_06290 [Gaiellales bacterium]|nr:hypothetical protein [Gaiellales bacterium]
MSTLIAALGETANIDTVYRDLYLGRARTLLTPVLPPEAFQRIEQQGAALAELPATITRALERANWPLVKELSQRAEGLKHAVDDSRALVETARAVYDVRDVRLDPFSPGLEPFTRISAHGLPALRTRVLDLLERLGGSDSAWKDFYAARRRAFETRLATASQMLEQNVTASSPANALEAARQALKAGDMKRLAALAETLSVAGAGGGGPSSRAASVGSARESVEPGEALQPVAFSSETRARARKLGLAPRHLDARLELAGLRRYAWTPSSDGWGQTAAAQVPLPPGSPGELRDGVAMFIIHPLVNSGGARYLPGLVDEDVLVEDFPDPADGQTPAAAELVTCLGLPGRRGLPRIAIERALLLHGSRIVEHELGLDPRLVRLVCIPPDVYLRLGEAEGWGRQPYWTHFDGYLIRTVAGQIRLQALAGGDTRYGGLYEMMAVGRDYDSDRLLARFAVVQRARMVAW